MKLEDYIAGFMRKSKLTQALFAAFEDMLTDMRTDSKSTENNAFIVTADENLNLHEKDVGLVSGGDINSRRAKVISRLRGWHITTVSEVESLIKAYGFSNVKVDENYAEYKITINTDAPKSDIFYDMCEALEEIKPAHLAVDGYKIESTPNEHKQIYAVTELIHTVMTIQCEG